MMRMKFVERLGVASVVLAGMVGIAAAAPKTAPSKTASKPAMKTSVAHHSTVATHKGSSTMKTSQLTGTVISASGSSLTIKPSQKRFGATKKISVPSSASVMLGSKKVGVSSLKAGEKVTVTMKGSTVTRINAMAGTTKAHTSKVHKA